MPVITDKPQILVGSNPSGGVIVSEGLHRGILIGENPRSGAIVSAPKQGVAGPSDMFAVYQAAIALSGHHFVCLNSSGEAIYADKDMLSHKDIVLGITTGATSMGGNAQIQTRGLMIEPSWTWTPEDTIYLGSNGLPVNISPTTGFSLIVGFALSATQIFIDIKQPIILI